MTDKEKIKAEVDRLKKLVSDPILLGNDIMIGERNAYNAVLEFIDSLPEEPSSNDLEEESYHAAMRMVNNHDLILPSTTNAQLCTAYQIFYKEAANWQKEQMMKGAIDAKLSFGQPVLLSHPVSPQIAKDGDKVKLIIIKI